MHLPEDLVVEILSRVPTVSSLARLRSTSKRWNTLVKDGRLAKKHSAYAPRQSPLVIMLINFRVYLVSINLNNNVPPSAKVTCQFSLKDPLSIFSKEIDIRSTFHLDGLLLCNTKDNRLVVWNPCSGETRWIQPRYSYKDSDCYALGYDNKSSCYKILRMHRFFVGNILHIESEVYDFASHSWRGVGESTSWFITQISCRRGVCVKGNTYWLAGGQYEPRNDHFLLRFDFSSERFQFLSLPADARRDYGNMALSVTKENQQLCLLATQVLDINVWMATKIESTGAILWSKFLTVTGADIRYRLQFNIGMSFLVDHEDKVVVSCNSVFPNIIHIVGEDKYIESFSSTMHLPEDLVVEILSRVPAVSLARLRSTSKEWNALIKYGRLAKKHSAYAPRQSSLVIMLINFRVYIVSINLHGINNNKDVPSAKLTGQFSLKDPLSNSSEEVGICSVFHCNGLLLCTTKANILVVLNPCSGEKMWIQPRVITYKEFNHYALGYDNRSSCYKILSVDRSGYRFPFQTEYQVYDFTSKSWRVVGETGGLLIPRIQRLGISVKGNTYWLANNGQGRVILQCYDFSTERFQSLSLPKDAPRWYSDVAL
ncbi:predicted protein [Arabidopsis lyrata subsp. lyrata]|uniref:Predicted protein n=1 Tax=Arabidopsis lyrata subsp. lyrata TaxID=81972 RepID=D7KZZ8_ARALL|nr:predicted protein [Arabidopsis lyrata subsp. lyrata]